MTTTTISDEPVTFDADAALEEIDALLNDVEISAQRNSRLVETLCTSPSTAVQPTVFPLWAVFVVVCGLGMVVGLGMAGFIL